MTTAQQVLVFTRTRYGADKLTSQLLSDDITAAAIHSSKSQSVRTRTLTDFRRGSVRILVATDVAARGLDIMGLSRTCHRRLAPGDTLGAPIAVRWNATGSSTS